jgi:formylglycine-generating enzyme required for sulfatase activity
VADRVLGSSLLSGTAVQESNRQPRGSPKGPKQVVALIHGMRTHATWAERVKAVLETVPGVSVEVLKYGYFDVFRFLSPLGTRSGPVHRIAQKLRALQVEHPNSEVSIVAHSYGTFIISRLLLQDPFLRLKRLILCGAVTSTEFPWAHVAHKIVDKVVNDCGTDDPWPILAASVTWGYGPSGTFGFGDPKVRDRFHRQAHSAFFDEAFVRQFWVPYLTDGEIVGTEWERTRPAPPFWKSGLAIGAIRAMLLCLAVLVAVVVRLELRASAPHPPQGLVQTEMVSLPAGRFRMGSSSEEIDAAVRLCVSLSAQGCSRSLYERESPTRQVFLSSYAIDKWEVTNRQFAAWLNTVADLTVENGDRLVSRKGQRFVDLDSVHGGLTRQDGLFEPRRGYENRPVTQITWLASNEYCLAHGKRLPTEAQWERAARSTDGRMFPWGDESPDCHRVAFGLSSNGPCQTGALPGPREVGSSPQDRSAEGAFDLAGNVSEWVEDVFQEHPSPCEDCHDPVADVSGAERVCKGGNWGQLAEMCRAAGRGRWPSDQVSYQVGFRCVAQ